MTTETKKVYCPDYDEMKPALTYTTALSELRRRLLRSKYYRDGKRNSSFSVGYVKTDDAGFTFTVKNEGTVKTMLVRPNRTITVIDN